MYIPSFTLHDGPVLKGLRSAEANWLFDKRNGHTVMWGKTPKEDMKMSPVPVILDMEVTTKCAGPGGVPCPFCYKANGPKGQNMTFHTFSNIINKMKFVTQVAFGADAQGTANPDLFMMMEYSRKLGIVPNITIADISDDTADRIAKHCGAVAVSRYADKNLCYDSVKKLTDRGMKQVNIHFMLSEETLPQLLQTFTDIKEDPRLAKLNAIVLLSLKKKGRGKTGFTSLTQEQFKAVVVTALALNVPFGFDSCSARKFEKAIESIEIANKAELLQLTVPCESTLESSYIDVNGDFYPCSFTEGSEGWEKGISVVEAEDFVRDVWYHERTQAFREKLWGCNRHCPIYEV